MVLGRRTKCVLNCEVSVFQQFFSFLFLLLTFYNLGYTSEAVRTFNIRKLYLPFRIPIGRESYTLFML